MRGTCRVGERRAEDEEKGGEGKESGSMTGIKESRNEGWKRRVVGGGPGVWGTRGSDKLTTARQPKSSSQSITFSLHL